MCPREIVWNNETVYFTKKVLVNGLLKSFIILTKHFAPLDEVKNYQNIPPDFKGHPKLTCKWHFGQEWD